MSLTSISFEGFDEYENYSVNEKTRVLQAEKDIYMLTEVEPGIFEYVYYATEDAWWWTNDFPEPPYGFGTLGK